MCLLLGLKPRVSISAKDSIEDCDHMRAVSL